MIPNAALRLCCCPCDVPRTNQMCGRTRGRKPDPENVRPAESFQNQAANIWLRGFQLLGIPHENTTSRSRESEMPKAENI